MITQLVSNKDEMPGSQVKFSSLHFLPAQAVTQRFKFLLRKVNLATADCINSDKGFFRDYVRKKKSSTLTQIPQFIMASNLPNINKHTKIQSDSDTPL